MFWSKSGFTLIEIMIAITLFAVYAAIYSTGQGGNLLDSLRIRENTKLYILANNTINELIVNPPEFKESLTSIKSFTKFEDYPNYGYAVEMKKIELPDFDAIRNEEDPQEDLALQKLIYTMVKKNFEKAVWQIQVTVQNNETKDQYDLSTWMMDDNVPITFTY